jgi:hypothetical protein
VDSKAAGFTMYRETTETVVLKTDEEDGHGGQIILEPGTRLAVDVVGLRTFFFWLVSRPPSFSTTNLRL